MLTQKIQVTKESRYGKDVAVVQIPQGDSTVTLHITNDLIAVGDEIGLGTLVLALNAAAGITTTVPATHETAWRALANSLNSAAEAFAFSASLYAVENAAPNTMDVAISVYSAEDILQQAPTYTGEFTADKVAVGYYDLMERVSAYHHIYAVDNGRLSIRLVLPSVLARRAEEFVTQLVTTVDYSIRAQVLHNPTGTPDDDNYDLAADRVVRVLHLPKYQLCGLSVSDELVNADGGGMVEVCDNEVFVNVTNEPDALLASQALTSILHRIGAVD